VIVEHREEREVSEKIATLCQGTSLLVGARARITSARANDSVSRNDP
jgi:hypothetical protein